MRDMTCPYCKYGYDHDGDFEALDNNNRLTEWCPKCEKPFYTYVNFWPHFSDGRPAPCEDGNACENTERDIGSHIKISCKHCGYSTYREKQND